MKYVFHLTFTLTSSAFTSVDTYLHGLPMRKMILPAALYCASLSFACAALDTAKIDELTGLKGKLNDKEGVYKITWPRSDVKVVVDGWTMPPFMGRSEEHTSELQSLAYLVCRLLLEKKK